MRAPEAFDAKGDNIAAVIFVNDVDGEPLPRDRPDRRALDRDNSVFWRPCVS